MHNNKTYIIIESSEVENIDFGLVQETSLDTLRYSLDGTKTFVKFEGDKPSFLSGFDSYTHSEILGVLNNNEWSVTE